jgi:hypothetical protein
MNIEMSSQRVVCAALRHEEGAIICGPRHFDPTMMAQGSAQGGDWRRAEQGFVDQFGKFLTREEARVIAEREGQVLRRFPCPNHMLFSEHLY